MSDNNYFGIIKIKRRVFLSNFKLVQRLEDNSFLINIFEDIQIRVFNDSRYFWYILVPTISELKDWHDLPIKVEKNLLIYTRKLS